MTHRILINCANLHHGGGVAVATSFISGLDGINLDGFEVSLVMSSTVERNLVQMGARLDIFESIWVKDIHGLWAIWSDLHHLIRNFDLTFTIFGPLYLLRTSGSLNLVGLAQPHVAYPGLSIEVLGHGWRAWVTRLGHALRRYFFCKADHLIVELESVKKALYTQSSFNPTNISVVPSAVDSIFFNPDRWIPLETAFPRDKIKLGIVSKNYPHKNLSILPSVKKQLAELFDMEVNIYVTFNEEEWQGCPAGFRSEIINIGPLTLAQCPTFYMAMDGVVFPTLLECFSAVPIEAAVLRRPLFVSDRSFITEVTGGHAELFDPMDSVSIARSIAEFFQLPRHEQERRSNDLFRYTERFHSSSARVSNYLSIIRSLLERQK